MVWHIGDVIRKLRHMAGWTLEELAARAGVNVNVIHGIEKGTTRDPRTSTLDRIGAPFGVTGLEIRQAVPPQHPLVLDVQALDLTPLQQDNADLALLLQEQRRKERQSA